jgi:hypothetical protein
VPTANRPGGRQAQATSGGQGIRTLDGCNPIAVFKTSRGRIAVCRRVPPGA